MAQVTCPMCGDELCSDGGPSHPNLPRLPKDPDYPLNSEHHCSPTKVREKTLREVWGILVHTDCSSEIRAKIVALIDLDGGDG